jgi:hypothetical protein
MFRRSRSAVAPHAQRRTRLFTIQPAPDERRMHRLVEGYTSRLCDEARARGEAPGRLVAIVLRKRALSSAGALAASCRRRLLLLQQKAEPADQRQLLLPLDDEDPLGDVEPDAVLGAHGLANVAHELRLLDEVARAAERASRRESKVCFLQRFLRRIHESAIVFTEYRDTLERLRRQLLPVRGDLQLLHGGMDLRERAIAKAAFNAGASLLLATDAASEGLNLHSRCRLLIHFELPWSPARLEQRAGRIDRIGQSRRPHEALLVANDTAERLVLAPLVARAARSRSFVSHAANLADTLVESQVAAAVIGETPHAVHAVATATPPFVEPPATLIREATAEADHLMELRRMPAHACDDFGHHNSGSVIASSIPRARRIASGLFAVYDVALIAANGSITHRELVAVHLDLAHSRSCRTPAALRDLLNRFLGADERHTRGLLQQRVAPYLAAVAARNEAAAAAIAERERAILRALPSAASRLVQAGLFDQRAIRASSARQQLSAARVTDAEWRLDAIRSASRVGQSITLCAAIVVAGG